MQALSGFEKLSGHDDTPQAQLTRRGVVLAGLAVLAVALAWRYSPRGLNAVAAPAVVALLVGYASVRRAAWGSVDVHPPPSGVPGETRTLAFDIEGSGLATVRLDFDGETVRADGDTSTETTVALPTTVEWTVELTERGIWEADSLEARIHGPLGLVERHVEVPLDFEIAVYPRRYDLARPPGASGQLHARSDVVTQEFDRVREYTPGDPLRQVDWNASAKHRDLHVVEFAERVGREVVLIAGVAARGADDEMARTMATLAEAALDGGLDVGVVAPDGRCEPDSGPAHRERVLRLLARTGPSTEADGYAAASTDPVDREADIVVDASDPPRGDAETTVRTVYGSHTLTELRRLDPTGADADAEVNS